MIEEQFNAGGVSLVIRRPGARPGELRAWDAADQQLVDQAHRLLERDPQAKVLIIDDQFGALTAGLAVWRPMVVADSAALMTSMSLNSVIFPEPPRCVSFDEANEHRFDLVVMRLPRQLDYLAWLLRWANGRLTEQGRILAGGMIKHLPDRCAELFGQLVQTETVYPARKKARVILARPGEATLEGWQDQWKGYELPGTGIRVEALPAVFAREKLDIGTRQILPFVSAAARDMTARADVLDLACGNGILGLCALEANNSLRVTFSDVSGQAVASARHTVQKLFSDASSAFFHRDGLTGDDNLYDLILLNPPFHEAGVVGDHIATRLLEQSASRLKPGGRLLMVGNRHLGYHKTLRRYFKSVNQLASHPKFVVFEAAHQSLGRS